MGYETERDRCKWSVVPNLIVIRNKEIKQIMNGGSIGYCINGKFFSLVKLKNYIEKIPKKEYCPF